MSNKQKKNYKNRIFKPIIVVIIILYVAWFLYNVIVSSDFFKASFSSIVSIGIVVIVSYYLVERRNDERSEYKKIDDLLYKIQEIISNDEFLSSEKTRDSRSNLILQRSVANKIKYLEDSSEGELVEMMQKLSETYNNFREFYGENCSNGEPITFKNEMLNYKCKIDDLCDKIHLMIIS